MKTGLYAVYDSAVEAFQDPIPFPADGAAMRAFGDVCADKETPLGKHPQHYSLFSLGWFDQSSGEIHVLTAPKLLMTGMQTQTAAIPEDE